MHRAGHPLHYAMRILLVTAVHAEAEAIGEVHRSLPEAMQRDCELVIAIAGIGRTNAAAVTTERILRRGPFDAVLNVGVAGALPGSELAIGAAIVASACIYVEEGLITPRGFADIEGMGFALGDFTGNTVPVDTYMLDALSTKFTIGPIATVATCSGTDEAALTVVKRTGALAEAMEGAAVVHAARRLHVPAGELRIISNTTGDRSLQQWDIDAAFAAMPNAVRAAVEALHSAR